MDMSQTFSWGWCNVTKSWIGCVPSVVIPLIFPSNSAVLDRNPVSETCDWRKIVKIANLWEKKNLWELTLFPLKAYLYIFHKEMTFVAVHGTGAWQQTKKLLTVQWIYQSWPITTGANVMASAHQPKRNQNAVVTFHSHLVLHFLDILLREKILHKSLCSQHNELFKITQLAFWFLAEIALNQTPNLYSIFSPNIWWFGMAIFSLDGLFFVCVCVCVVCACVRVCITGTILWLKCSEVNWVPSDLFLRACWISSKVARGAYYGSGSMNFLYRNKSLKIIKAAALNGPFDKLMLWKWQVNPYKNNCDQVPLSTSICIAQGHYNHGLWLGFEPATLWFQAITTSPQPPPTHWFCCPHITVSS